MGKNADTLCHQILREKRIRLIRINFRDTFGKNNGYAVDESGNVTGLNLSGQMLKETAFLKDFETLQWLDLSKNRIADISFLRHLKNLTKLDLNQNRVTDISGLGELKKLTWLNLSNNRITMLPGDIPGWGMEIKLESEHSTGIILANNPLEKSLKSAIESGRKALIEYFRKEVPGDNKFKKILILASNPRATPQLRLDEEVRDSVESLLRSRYRDRFDIRSRGAVRRRDMRTALLDYEAHIVHFTGHGKEDALLMEDELGFSAPMSAEALGELFKMFSTHVECVVLNACYSANQAKAISKHIPYVIGMREKIHDKSSIEFAVGFYDALGAGRSIEEAFEFGCIAIHSAFPGETQHLIPALEKRGGSPGRPVITSRSLEEERRDVFLSYASEDEERFVKPFAGELDKRGITYWADKSEIKGGNNFVKAINTGLRTSRFVVAFLSKNFMGKEWPEKELFSSIGKKTGDGRPVLIPIFIAPEKDILDHYRLLSDVNYIKWNSVSDTAEALACSIKTNEGG